MSAELQGKTVARSAAAHEHFSSLCLASRFCQPVTLQTTSEAAGVAPSPACRLAICSATSSFDSFPTGVSGPPASSSTPSLPAGRGSRFHPSGRPAALRCRSPGRPLPEWSAAPAVRRHLAVPVRPLSVACPRARFSIRRRQLNSKLGATPAPGPRRTPTSRAASSLRPAGSSRQSANGGAAGLT